MDRLEPSSTLLLVIDLQERLVPAIEPQASERALKATDLLLTAAELLGVRVVATEQYPKGLGPTVPALLGPLEKARAERVEKTAFSALDAPRVAAVLGEVAPRAVVVVGFEAHVCVYQTVRDLRARGLQVHVPHDGVGSRREADRAAALGLYERLGAFVTTSESVVFDWLRKAEGEAFKALSKKMR